ncbi:methyltransferase-like protein 25B isoform X2 [Ahaetulla prasina]|uniref:methyltransferase-like protein 25B isoform X2 n=1 Tax=Ahaetulla prasina TaxID=499056 RepID=UPI00264A4A80|nr:methyltransferase-like protein 25B isoform X2 [Ahaetulla prasina]
MRKRRPAGETSGHTGSRFTAFPEAWKPAPLGRSFAQPRGRARGRGRKGGSCWPTDRRTEASPSEPGSAPRAVGGECGRWAPGDKLVHHARLRPGAAEAPGRQSGPRPRALPAVDRRLRHRKPRPLPLPLSRGRWSPLSRPAPASLFLSLSLQEFFSDDLWGRLPRGWQAALGELSPPEVAALLLRKGRPGELWPLSLLAFRAAAHALPFPRRPAAAAREPPLPPRFRRHLRPKKQHEVRQLAQVLKRLSELTGCRRVVDVGAGQGHLARFLAFGLRLSVTAVEGDARLVAQAAKFDRALALELEKERARRQAPDTPPVQGPSLVVGWINPDTPWPEFVQLLRSGKAVGDGSSRGTTSGRQPTQPCEPRETEAGKGGADRGGNGPDSLEQNPPTHLQAQYPQGPLLLTGLHACGDLSATLLRLFVACPDIVGITSVSCCYMKLSTGEGTQPGYPLSNWVAGLPGHQLSYKAREGACHAMEDYILRLEHNSPSLKTHCYRARLETLIRAIDPTKKRLGVQAIPKTHEMTFEQFPLRARPSLQPSALCQEPGAGGCQEGAALRPLGPGRRRLRRLLL